MRKSESTSSKSDIESLPNISKVWQVILEPPPEKRHRGGGRSKDEVWQYFRPLEDSKWQCKQCMDYKVKCPQADRLRKHHQKCQVRAMMSAAEEYRTQESVAGLATTMMSSPSDEIQIFSTSKTKVKPPKQISKQILEKKNVKQKQEMDLKLTKLVCAANLSFEIVENPYFLAFINAIGPGYDVPSAEVLSTTLLDSLYEDVKSDARKGLQGKKAVIMQGGCNSFHSETVVTHSFSANFKTYFLEVSSAEEEKTALFCMQKLEEAIAKAEDFGTEVIGCITDNFSELSAISRHLLDKNPNLLIYGCNAYLLNLVGNDMISVEVKNKVIDTQKFFRSNEYAATALKNLQGAHPVIPTDSGLNSLLESYWSFFSNQAKYLEISIMEECKVTDSVRATLADSDTLLHVQLAFEILKPIACALDNLEHDNSTVADAVACWLQVRESLRHHASDIHFVEKFQLGTTITSVVAYMLHPSYKGKDLDSLTREKGRIWLGKVNPYYVSIAVALAIGDEDFFPASLMEESLVKSINPATWWATVAMDNPNKFPKHFQDLVDTLMRLPSSTAGINRCFAGMTNLIMDSRNGLSIETANKVCFISHALKK